MYMLIPMDFIILANYVYDSTGFWMLVNYVCVDSTGVWNTCKLLYMLIPMDFIILANYVYGFYWGFECL